MYLLPPTFVFQPDYQAFRMLGTCFRRKPVGKVEGIGVIAEERTRASLITLGSESLGQKTLPPGVVPVQVLSHFPVRPWTNTVL